MKTAQVSFGKVVAVRGKPKKMDKINKKLYPYAKNGQIMIKDVTAFYKNASSDGEMAQAAQRGESVDIYITGSDIKKIQQKEPGWKCIKDILGNVEDYFCVNQMFIGDAISKVLETDRKN